MLTIIAIAVVAIIAAFIFKGSNFSNRVRQIGDAVNEGLSEPGADSKYAIADAKDEAAAFRSDIAALISANMGLTKRHDAAHQEVNKFEAFAAKSGTAGDKPGVIEALGLKKKAEALCESLSKQISANQVLLTKLRDQLASYESQISDAQDDQARLVVAEKSAQLRKSIAAHAAGISGGKGLASLGKIKERAEAAEDTANAYEEMASTSTAGKGASLEAKYGESHAVGDDEVSKYMKT